MRREMKLESMLRSKVDECKTKLNAQIRKVRNNKKKTTVSKNA